VALLLESDAVTGITETESRH